MKPQVIGRFQALQAAPVSVQVESRLFDHAYAVPTSPTLRALTALASVRDVDADQAQQVPCEVTEALAVADELVGMAAGTGRVRTFRAPHAEHRGRVNDFATVLGGRGFVTAGQDHELKLWRVDDANDATLCFVDSFRGHTDAVCAIEALPSSPAVIASASIDGTVCVWSITRRCRVAVLDLSSVSPVLALTQAPWDPAVLLLGCADGSLVAWHYEANSIVASTPAHASGVRSVHPWPSSSAAFLSVGAAEREVRAWDHRALSSAAPCWRLDTRAAIADVTVCAPGLVVTCSRSMRQCCNLAVHDVAMPTRTSSTSSTTTAAVDAPAVLSGHASAVRRLAALPGSSIVASADCHGFIKVWDASQAACVANISTDHPVAVQMRLIRPAARRVCQVSTLTRSSWLQLWDFGRLDQAKVLDAMPRVVPRVPG